jgi:hypothetical protein
MELTDEQKRAVRAAARERKRKQRERDKQKRVRALEAQQVAVERAERRRRNLCFFGEITTGHNATTFEEELAVHREFLRALREPDIQDGESLRSVAQRAFRAWVAGPFASRDGRTIYVPGFNRAAQKFDSEFGFVIDDVPFDEVWSPPKDCSGDEPIEVDALPELPNLPKAPMKLEPVSEPTTLPPPPAMAAPPGQPNAISYTWIHPSANRYLNGRWANPYGEIQ